MEMNEFDKVENLSDFTKRCLKNDRVIGGGCYEWFMKCWTESEDYNDFIRCQKRDWHPCRLYLHDGCILQDTIQRTLHGCFLLNKKEKRHDISSL